MSSIRAAGSTALIMSNSVSAATLTAVRAFHPTPVRSVVRTVAAIPIAASWTLKSTSIPLSGSGWQSGIKSLVCFSSKRSRLFGRSRAHALGRPPAEMRSTTSAVVRMKPTATAVRAVTVLSVTSTMCAAPLSSRCDKRCCGPVATVTVDDRDRVQVGQVGSRYGNTMSPNGEKALHSIGSQLTTA